MSAYNTSSAYKLPAYEAGAAPKRQPKLEVVSKRSDKRTLAAVFTPQCLGSFTIVVTLLFLMIYNHVCLNEVAGEINEMQAGITELESEYVKISSELESMVSLRVVSERARDELGLDRLDKYQTKYVYLYEDDKIILAEEPSKTAPDGEVSKIQGIVDSVLEYIR